MSFVDMSKTAQLLDSRGCESQARVAVGYACAYRFLGDPLTNVRIKA